MSWPLVTLGEVCIFVRGPFGGALKKDCFVEDGYAVYEQQHAIYNQFNNIRYFVDELKFNELQRFKLNSGDLIMSCSGTMGKIAIVPENIKTGIINQALLKLTPSEKVDLNYLKYWLESESFQLTLNDNTHGAAIKNVASVSVLKAIKIPLPPLAVQKRIAAILDKADAIRQKRQQAINLADDFLRSVFLDMFGDPVTNPKGWEVKKFGDVIDVLTDYHANGSYKTLVENVTLLDEPSYAYMVRTTDLEKQNYTDSVKYIDEHAYQHLSKSKVFGGEIIINKIGSAGALYLMPFLNRPVSLAMNQFMVRCNELSSNEFMYFQLKTNAGAREISKRVQGAVTKTITKDAVREVPIILPPIKLQQEFIKIVRKFKQGFASKEKYSCQSAIELFNSISQKAFAGEL